MAYDATSRHRPLLNVMEALPHVSYLRPSPTRLVAHEALSAFVTDDALVLLGLLLEHPQTFLAVFAKVIPRVAP